MDQKSKVIQQIPFYLDAGCKQRIHKGRRGIQIKIIKLTGKK
jgi:hypothetical protein